MPTVTTDVYGRDPEPVDLATGTGLWSVVGGTDALADASDSTYAQAGQSWTGSGFGLTVVGPRTGVTLDDPGVDPGGADTLDQLVLHLRFRQTVNTRAGVGPPYFQMSFYDDVTSYPVDPPAVPLINDTDVHDYVWDWTPDDNGFGFGWPSTMFRFGPVRWHIGQGADLAAGPGSGDTQHRIYEAWMHVAYTTPTPTTVLRNAERSSAVHIKSPDGTWADIHLAGV